MVGNVAPLAQWGALRTTRPLLHQPHRLNLMMALRHPWLTGWRSQRISATTKSANQAMATGTVLARMQPGGFYTALPLPPFSLARLDSLLYDPSHLLPVESTVPAFFTSQQVPAAAHDPAGVEVAIPRLPPLPPHCLPLPLGHEGRAGIAGDAAASTRQSPSADDDVKVVADGEDSSGGAGGAYNTRCDGTYRRGNMICWVECPVCRIDHGVACCCEGK